MELTDQQKELVLKFQQNEITGNILYHKLAQRQKDTNNREVLDRIADDELKHYEAYKKLTDKDIGPSKWQVFKYSMFSYILGPTFSTKLMENNEAKDQIAYAKLANIPEIVPIIEDEEKHEQELIGMINEVSLEYMGSVVLGLNDALIELTGVLAGVTFALHSAALIILTGSVTGFAAALSMAASEYFSTKSEGTGKRALTASIYTGIAYILTVVLLILPYLLFHNVYVALVLTIILAVLIIAGFNYYYAVVRDEKFIRRFAEMAFLSIGVAFLSFAAGILLKKLIGVDV